MSFVNILPTNELARLTLYDAFKEAEAEGGRQESFFTSSARSVNGRSEQNPSSAETTMINLQLDGDILPSEPWLGWTFGQGNEVDVRINPKPRAGIVNVPFRLYIVPDSGLAAIEAESEESGILYQDDSNEWMALRKEAKILFSKVTQFSFPDGRQFDFRYVLKESLFPVLADFLLKHHHKSIHTAGRRNLFGGLRISPEYNKYALGERIGTGMYGDVFYAVNTISGATVAVKDVRVISPAWCNEMRREIELMDRLKIVPNILRCHDAWCSKHRRNPRDCPTPVKEHFYIATDLAIYDFSSISFSHFSLSTILQLFQQMLVAIKHMHAEGVMHRDVTLSNMLIMQEDPPRAALADFGKACTALRATETGIGPVSFCPPEVWTKEYTNAIDLWFWAFAVALKFGYSLPTTLRDERISEATLTVMRTELRKLHHAASGRTALMLDLVLGILKWDVGERYTVDEALSHDVWQEHDNSAQDLKRSRCGSSQASSGARTQDAHRKKLRDDGSTQQESEGSLETIPFSPPFYDGLQDQGDGEATDAD